MRYCVLLLACLASVSCTEKTATLDDIHTRDVSLPGGQVIKAEVMFDATDMMRGMMFRTSVAPDHGMLFLHRAPGRYGYWMFQTLIPLDIIWMDSSKRIVEIAAECAAVQDRSQQVSPLRRE